jgi:predicted ester cyclase
MALIERAERLFAALNSGDVDAAVAMVSPSAEIRIPSGPIAGAEGYRAWLETLFRAIPDMHHQIQGLVGESEQTIGFEYRVTGTFSGPLATPGGDAPPTGNAIDMIGADFWKFEGDLIVAYDVYYDQLEFFRQLGLTPPG